MGCEDNNGGFHRRGTEKIYIFVCMMYYCNGHTDQANKYQYFHKKLKEIEIASYVYCPPTLRIKDVKLKGNNPTLTLINQAFIEKGGPFQTVSNEK